MRISYQSRWRQTGLLAAFLAALVSGLAASGPETNAPAKTEFGGFKIITERNIFNTARSRRYAGTSDEERPARVDTITLVGTLAYDKGPYAFFDGSSSRFRQVLDAGKSIAGYTITEVNADRVKMAAGTNNVELRIGMQLRREEDGEWQVTGRAVAEAAASASTSAAADTSSGDADAITKRLMQQREQELK
jgi:hypothetical protein